MLTTIKKRLRQLSLQHDALATLRLRGVEGHSGQRTDELGGGTGGRLSDVMRMPCVAPTKGK
jgi:hypothetical protein